MKAILGWLNLRGRNANKVHGSAIKRLIASIAISCALGAHADPVLTSWFTTYSGKYARVYTNAAAATAGNVSTTWNNGSQVQTLPAYCGLQELYSSSNWVYLRTTGLGSHTMGPWSANFPNLPANTKVLYTIPRTTSVPASKTLTGLGAIGYFVDGVSMFDTRDAFYWNGSSEVNGSGYWNRDAYVNESATFDPAYAHQENTGTYHYHANPIALRYLVGDHVDYNAATRTFSESTNALIHSPILGWVRDGFPIYGPYGYSNATNAASGIRRMTSGYALRNGQNGTQNLTSTGRTNIPQWAVRVYNVSAGQSGPSVSTTYPLGRYLEDNDYLGDLGKTQGVDFDLDQYNGRYCVTPEFPNGTYAYFVCVSSNGTPLFPYNIGRAFYGNPTGSSVTSISESVVTNFLGGPNASPVLNPPANSSGMVTLTWSATEGGTYRIEASTNLSTWSTNATGIAAVTNSGRFTGASPEPQKFFRVIQTSLASYDPVSGTSGGGGSGATITISPATGTHGTVVSITATLSNSATPNVPPAMAGVASFTIGSMTVSNPVHASQYVVTGSLTIPANATLGTQTATITFSPPQGQQQGPSYTQTGAFTVQ